MKKNTLISNEDKILFKKAVAGSTPIKSNSLIPDVPKRSVNQTVAKKRHLENDKTLPTINTESILGIADNLSFCRSKVQKKAFSTLRKGRFSIEARLDLHNMTIATANRELISFIDECVGFSLKYVHIIHGKGFGSKNNQPIIKNEVNNSLRNISEVLAFCSARQADGGTGAVYVLLKTSLSNK